MTQDSLQSSKPGGLVFESSDEQPPLAFSVCLPNCKEGKTQPAGAVNISWIKEIALAGEALEFDGLWVSELLQAQGGADSTGKIDIDAPPSREVNYFDPISTLGYVTALTERVRLTTATVVLPQHHPLTLSRQIATLDQYSGGRIVLGVGLGGSATSFRKLRRELGTAHRGNMMDEYLQALRLQWEQPRSTFAGQYVSFENAEAYPKPLQRPLPVLVAGNNAETFRRSAEFGQGWIDSHTLPGGIIPVVEQIRQYRAGFHREPTRIQVARQFYMSLAPTLERAQQIVSSSVGSAEDPQTDLSENRRIIGTPADFVELLTPYAEAGVTEICCIFYGQSKSDILDQMELFATEVRPRIRLRVSGGFAKTDTSHSSERSVDD